MALDSGTDPVVWLLRNVRPGLLCRAKRRDCGSAHARLAALQPPDAGIDTGLCGRTLRRDLDLPAIAACRHHSLAYCPAADARGTGHGLGDVGTHARGIG